MRMDITVDRYATWEDLRGYMRGSAAVIGEMMAPLLGAAGPDAPAPGRAARRGVPADQLHPRRRRGPRPRPASTCRWRTSSGSASARTSCAAPGSAGSRRRRCAQLLAFEVRRALELYEDARPGLAMVDTRSRPCLEAAFVLYRQILAEVVAADHNVFAGRLSVPALAAAGHRGPGRRRRRRGGLAGPSAAQRRHVVAAHQPRRPVTARRTGRWPDRSARTVSGGTSRARPGADPHPGGAGQQHQREPEEQVLHRRPDQPAVAEEGDPRGAEDGVGGRSGRCPGRSASRW